MYKGEELKKRLRQGRPVYGLLHGLSSPLAAELAALAGYDAIIIDAEHGSGDRSTYLNIAQAISAGGAACFLRLASHDPVALSQALDLGVDGLLVPGVQTQEQAEAIVLASRYPPAGTRGYGLSMARASGYGLYPKPYAASVSDGVFIAAIIESRLGVKHAAAIARTQGIDAVVVGLQDLCGEMGLAGQVNHEEVQQALADVEKAVLAEGKTMGAAVSPEVDLSQLLARGHRFITLGVDTRLLGTVMREQLDKCPDRMRKDAWLPT